MCVKKQKQIRIIGRSSNSPPLFEFLLFSLVLWYVRQNLIWYLRVFRASTNMYYKSFSTILTIYGYSPETSYSYFYSNVLLVLSILNLVASFVYFNTAVLNHINITDIITISTTYVLQVTHCVVLAHYVINIGLRDKFYEKLYEFDREIADKSNSKVKRQAEVNLNRKILCGWIISVSFLSMASYSIITDGLLAILWLRALPGLLSIQLKYVHIFFFVELLKQRLEVYSTVLEELINEETITELKICELRKLYTKLIEIMDLINEIFGADLIFMVMHNFLDIIFNIFSIFLAGFYYHAYEEVQGNFLNFL